MAAKKYVNNRHWRWQDPRTGDNTHWVENDPYTGPLDNPYLLAPGGPDGKGPLIREDFSSPSAPSVDSSIKEK